MKKKFLSILLAVCMVLTMLPVSALAADTLIGDFSVVIEKDGAAPTFADGVLTFSTAGKYTVGMAEGKALTSEVIKVTANDVTLNLNGVVIDAPIGTSSSSAGANALTANNTVLNILADSSFTGGIGGIVDPMDVGYGGSGISGNVTVTGTKTLTVIGGVAGSGIPNNSKGGSGINGNIAISDTVTLIATGGYNLNNSGSGNTGGDGISGNLAVTGYATVNATGGEALSGNHGRGLTGTLTATDFIIKAGFSGSTDNITVGNPLLNQFRYITVDPTASPSLPTATEYAAASPAAASGTDYELDTGSKTLVIKTAKSAAFWSASGTTYLTYTVKLANDVDVSAFLWTPVGGDTSFTGSFDGQGHTIKGLTILRNGMSRDSAGLFGTVDNATIKNVGLIDSSVTVTNAKGLYYNEAGGIVGDARDGAITNCYTIGSVAISGSGSYARAGGIAGYVNGTAITNCYHTGKVAATTTDLSSSIIYAGGIVGGAMRGTFSNCYYLTGAGMPDKGINAPYSTTPTVTGCGTFDSTGTLTVGTADNFVSAQTLAYGDALLAALNSWVNATASTDYYTWKADSTPNVNGGYPVLDKAWVYTPPTAAEYAAAAPAAASGTDYELDTGSKTLVIKTAKGAAFWSASGTTYLDYAVKLANDIDVSAFIWSSVGTWKNAFTGTFDGQGHSIAHLTVYETGNHAGFFGQTSGSMIKNLCIASGSITAAAGGESYAGSIVGIAQGNSTIINCCNHADVFCTSSSASQTSAGGIAGSGYNPIITNCYNTGNITAACSKIASYAGGIVGTPSYGTVANCYNTGKISASGATSNYAAGLIGYANYNGSVTNCFSKQDSGLRGYSDPAFTFTGCGTFADNGGALTAGTAAKCGTKQTLAAYAADLLSALNGWVNVKTSTDYDTWKADDTTTPVNSGYPVFGNSWVPTLTGTVTISGTQIYGSTLTATYGSGNNTGTLSYQWKRGGTNIGTSSNTYTIVKDDIGQTLTCTVTSDAQTGSVTSDSTAAIAKEDGTAVTGVSAVGCTTACNNDGKLTGVTAAMEYKKSGDATYTPGTGSDITGLASGDYLVRVKETDISNAGADSTFTVAAYVPAALTGTVTITGAEKYGATLTATYGSGNNTGTLSYQWKRGGTNIGTNSNTYTIVEADIGQTLTCVVASAEQTGSVTSDATATIDKADGPAVTGVSAVDCTHSGNNNGRLTGVTTAMEYKKSGDASYITGTGSDITGLTNGDYLVRVKETDTNNAGADSTFAIHAMPVVYKTLVSISAPAAITGIANGTAKTADALGLPKTVALATDNGNVSANVNWNITGCGYDISKITQQTFTVNGTVTLPAGVVNPNNVALTTTISVTVKAATGGTPAQTITGYLLDYTTKIVPYNTDFASLGLPDKIKAAGNELGGLWVKVTEWLHSTYQSNVAGTYTVTAVLDSGYTASGYVDSGFVLGSGVHAPEIRVTVKEDSPNSNKGGSKSTSSSSPVENTDRTETKVDSTGNTATVTTKPDSVNTNGDTTSIETTVPSVTIDNTPTSTNGSVVDTAKKSAITINVPTESIVQQLAAKRDVDLTLTVPHDVARDAVGGAAITINANREILEAAKENLTDVTIKIKDADTQQIAYSWTFKGADLAKSTVPVKDVNIAMSVHLTTEVPKVNVITPTNKGLVLSFDHSGLLPSVASVKFSALEKGFKPGQTLYFYYYNPTTKQIESLGNDAYTVDVDGNVTVQIRHCSDYVLLPKAARNITLDTRTYTMQPKKSYEIGVKLTNASDTTIKAYSSTKGIANVTVLKNGNVKVTGTKPGLTYIMIDVYDKKNKFLTHASVRVTVQNGVKPNGNSARQHGLF